MTREEKRLREATERRAHWKRCGPYLSERAWGTVREDYSPGGTAWDYLPQFIDSLLSRNTLAVEALRQPQSLIS